jgi:hypothetical protein
MFRGKVSENVLTFFMALVIRGIAQQISWILHMGIGCLAFCNDIACFSRSQTTRLCALIVGILLSNAVAIWPVKKLYD